mgnify:CR=1 FL=1
MLRRIKLYAGRAVVPVLVVPVCVMIREEFGTSLSDLTTALKNNLFDANYAWLAWIAVGIVIGSYRRGPVVRRKQSFADPARHCMQGD